MKSRTTRTFWQLFRQLPTPIRRQAADAYRRWQDNPYHPGLRFKRVHASEPIYSLRVSRSVRALGLREGDTVTGFWIGTHDDYERTLKS